MYLLLLLLLSPSEAAEPDVLEEEVEEEVEGSRAHPPHPFLADMGLPEPMGEVDVRVAGVRTRIDDEGFYDAALHIEAGMLPWLGADIRADAVAGRLGAVEFSLMASPFVGEPVGASAIVVVGARTSGDDAPGLDDHHTEEPRVGLGGGLGFRATHRRWLAFDATVHTLSPPVLAQLEVMVEGAVSAWIAGPVAAVFETAAHLGEEEQLVTGLLGGKFELGPRTLVGVAVQMPWSDDRTADLRALFQLELLSG